MNCFMCEMVFVHVEGHQLVIDLTAYKERLMEEMFTVYSARDKRKTISIVFHARVLGQCIILN